MRRKNAYFFQSKNGNIPVKFYWMRLYNMAPQLMLGSAGSLLELRKKHYKYEIILTFNLLVLKIDKSYRAIPTIYLCFSHLKLDVLSTVILYPNRYKFTYIA